MRAGLSVALCFSVGAIQRVKNSCDIIICPKEIEDFALKKADRVIIVKGQVKDHSDYLTDADFKLSLKLAGLGLITNSSYKYVLNGVLEVLELLEELNPSEVHCFGGGGLVALSTVFGDNIESSYALLTCKSYVINEAVKQWCVVNDIILIWQRFLKIRILFEFSLRCIVLLAMSIGAIIVGKNQARFLESSCGRKIAIYRSDMQREILLDLPFENFKVPKNNKFNRGKKRIKRFFSTIVLIFLALKKICTVCLGKSRYISYRFNGTNFCFKALPTVIENICLLEHKYYSFLLNQRIKNSKIEQLYSCEMISRFAWLDREVCDNFSVLSIGVQAGLLSQLAVPIFPVHHKFITMSSTENSNLSKIYKSEEIYFKGPLKTFEAAISTNIDILIITQPYAQDVIQKSIIKIANHYPSLRCKVRAHPRDNHRYDLTYSKVSLDSNEKCIDSIMQSKLVIGMTSTALYDASDADKKVIIISMDEYTKNVMKNGYDMQGKTITTSIDELIDEIKNHFLDSYVAD